jgi:redox-sensitive bicupin YhaK (pirin superfamily)
MLPPRYQLITDHQIPTLALPAASENVRFIAGECLGVRGPAQTCTIIDLWDIQLTTPAKLSLPIPEGYTAILVVRRGSVSVSGGETVDTAEVGLFERAGDHINIESAGQASILLLAGEPIDEPISGSGPFVMNTAEEINRQSWILKATNGTTTRHRGLDDKTSSTARAWQRINGSAQCSLMPRAA